MVLLPFAKESKILLSQGNTVGGSLPSNLPKTIQISIDSFASSTQLGARPITVESLSSKAHSYLPRFLKLF
jgi:hypothetical protein